MGPVVKRLWAIISHTAVVQVDGKACGRASFLYTRDAQILHSPEPVESARRCIVTLRMRSGNSGTGTLAFHGAYKSVIKEPSSNQGHVASPIIANSHPHIRGNAESEL